MPRLRISDLPPAPLPTHHSYLGTVPRAITASALLSLSRAMQSTREDKGQGKGVGEYHVKVPYVQYLKYSPGLGS